MLTFPAYISGVRTMADGSLRIQVDTQELPPETMTSVFGFKKSLGAICFIPDARTLTEEEEKFIAQVASKLSSEHGSKSKILRNMIYGLWKEKKPQKSFEEFYDESMDLFISLVKEKTDEIRHGT